MSLNLFCLAYGGVLVKRLVVDSSYSINSMALVVLVGSSFLSYVFFVGFSKYYRRYTDEVLMAIVALDVLETQPDRAKSEQAR